MPDARRQVVTWVPLPVSGRQRVLVVMAVVAVVAGLMERKGARVRVKANAPDGSGGQLSPSRK